MERKINEDIFKAYDIRGTYPDELNEDIAYWIGRSFTCHFKPKKVAVGIDMRESSPKLEEAFIKGAVEQGADVIKIGLATTPMVYFASANLNVDAAVAVTASHNPAQWNGFKLCLKGAIPVGEGSGMEEIKKLVISKNIPASKIKGSVSENYELKNKYVDYIASFFKKNQGKSAKGGSAFGGKRIVADFANGMGIIDKAVFEKLSDNLEMTYLFDNFDGTFPNHEANPLKTETLATLKDKVKNIGADLGIAYDGDADRVGFVDEKGEIVPMDYMIAILAKEVLKKYPGGTILMDLRSSNAVKEVIEEAGGVVLRCRVGHSLIKKQMREVGAVFAGELSGHYFFEQNSKAEMPTLAAIMIINLLNETGGKLSEFTRQLKRYYHSSEINSDVADKEAMMKKLKKIYRDGKLDELDGVRIDYPDWWFNVRPSNTEPKLRLNVEAKSKELMEEKRDELLKLIRE